MGGGGWGVSLGLGFLAAHPVNSRSQQSGSIQIHTTLEGVHGQWCGLVLKHPFQKPHDEQKCWLPGLNVYQSLQESEGRHETAFELSSDGQGSDRAPVTLHVCVCTWAGPGGAWGYLWAESLRGLCTKYVCESVCVTVGKCVWLGWCGPRGVGEAGRGRGVGYIPPSFSLSTGFMEPQTLFWLR